MAATAHIRNPLSIIGIFAALVEVMGIGTLPFLKDEIQGIYIWFLMAFPLFLVSAFFYTLIRHPKSLYAPGDFQQDSSWLAANVNPASEIQINKKIETSISEDESKVIATEPGAPPLAPPAAKVELAEGPQIFTRNLSDSTQKANAPQIDYLKKQAIDLIGAERRVDFTRNVTLVSSPDLVVDALAVADSCTIMVEIKHTNAGLISNESIQRVLRRAEHVFQDLPAHRAKGFEFVYCLIYRSTTDKERLQNLKMRFQKEAAIYPFSSTIKFINQELLQG